MTGKTKTDHDYFMEGQEAYRDNPSVNDNPYVSTGNDNAERQWDDGYRAAYESAEGH